MWHTAEMVKIFEKMTEGYGYDIYQNRKLCVALCNDLFADYSVEKNIMQMLFQAGFGEAMKGVPFKSERELKMGLSNIEKFLMAQAIESSVRDDVLDVMRLAFVDKGVNSEVKSAYQPVISKNFNDFHFKMTLPAKSKINIKMIDQGSSELNIIIGVRNRYFEDAIRTIYGVFVPEA